MLDAYASFSRELADGAATLLRRVVDRRAGRGRASVPGAFCAYTVPSHHPYLLLNWTSRRRDVLTLAHELGPRAARVPRARARDVPPDDAADAGRDRVGVRRDRDVRPAARRIDDPAGAARAARSNLEDQIATVFRQIAMNRFEDRDAHRSGASEGELSVEQLRRAVGRDPDRDARRRGRDHRGLPHVVVVHPALHRARRLRVRVRLRPAARAVGVPRSTRSGATTSCRSTSICCAPADRWRPRSWARSSGVDLADPGFWDGGLDIVAEQLEAAEAAAKATAVVAQSHHQRWGRVRARVGGEVRGLFLGLGEQRA